MDGKSYWILVLAGCTTVGVSHGAGGALAVFAVGAVGQLLYVLIPEMKDGIAKTKYAHLSGQYDVKLFCVTECAESRGCDIEPLPRTDKALGLTQKPRNYEKALHRLAARLQLVNRL
jgi:hypothetical protein